MNKLVFFIGVFASSFAYAQKIILPVEVLGEEGKTDFREVVLTQEQAEQVESLWLQVNNMAYENKASIRINDAEWIDLNHQSVDMRYQEKARGGMVHGGFSTIRFKVAVSGFTAGVNTIAFRFNRSDGVSIGYRVIQFNLLDASDLSLLDPSLFEEEDPMEWTAPEGYQSASDISEGKYLWENGSLWSNYLHPDSIGSWYSYDLQPAVPIRATCADCHISNGYDLEYFAYSNESIMERSIFHGLSEEEGNKIAAYIRSLSSEIDGLERYGRPWNPPYQPGPGLEHKSIDEWAAGAGLDAVLDKDEDMLDYMFPGGVNEQSVKDYFDADKVGDHTLTPLAVQFPDWKHWLPLIHPMDAFTIGNYYDEPTVTIHPKIGIERMENFLNEMPVEDRNPEQLKTELRVFHRHFRHFVDQATGDVRHWRTAGDALREGHTNERVSAIPDDVSVEMTMTSLARLLAVKNFEIMNLHDLQDKNEWFVIEEDYDELTPRRWQWVGVDYNIFEVPPHFTSCVESVNCDNFVGQPFATGRYESTNWYQLQLVLNGGNGNVGGNDPMDWQYQLSFILKASSSSGIYEPLRYFHSLNAMYQLRTYEKHKTPNVNGFRARQQMPHWFYGLSDSNNYHDFAPGAFIELLDEIQPGLTKMFVEAMLQHFLDEVGRPEMDLDDWNRQAPHGGAYELEPASKNDALINVETTLGLYYYVDKMYYLIPRFAELGVDCNIIHGLVDWCSEAWPNYNWEQFRSSTTAVVEIEQEQTAACENFVQTFHAIAGNQGENPLFEWYVNGTKHGGYAPSYSTDDLLPGDVVAVRLLGNNQCAEKKEARAEYTVPRTGFRPLINKNGNGWADLENAVVCLDDQVAIRVDVDVEPVLWLDAYQIAESEHTNGAVVTNWLDRSGNGYDISAAEESLYPTYNSTGMNGLPAVMFGMNNDADGLRLFDTSQDDFMEDDWSVIIVGQELERQGDWADVIGNKTESRNDDGWFIRFSQNGASQVSAGGDYYQGSQFDHPIQFIAVLSKKERTITFSINGKNIEGFTMKDGERITTDYDIYLGLADKGNANSSRFHRGPISEVMFFDYALSVDEQQYLEGYLGHKWKMDEYLQQTHAHKEQSPLSITMKMPQGDEVQFDGNTAEYTYEIHEDNIGDLLFFHNQSNCLTPQATSSFILEENVSSVQDAVRFSRNNRSYISGWSAKVRPGDELIFSPNFILGHYEWEKPDGSRLEANVDPTWTIRTEDPDVGEWKLHADFEGCSDQLEQVVTFDLSYASPDVYTLTEVVSTGGSTNIMGTVEVDEFSDFNVMILPDSGYHVESIILDGYQLELEENFGEPVSYVLNQITSDHTFEVVFDAINYHIIELSIGDGGRSNLREGLHYVAEGDDLMFTFEPDSGYAIERLVIDGIAQNVKDRFTFSDVEEDHTVAVDFVAVGYYYIDIVVGDGGIASLAPGTYEFIEGETLDVTFTPDQGYIVEAVLIDEVDQGAIESVTLGNINSNHTLEVVFRPRENFEIEVFAGNGGSSYSEGITEVVEASSFRVVFTPDEGYQVEDVVVDNESKGPVTEYTFQNIASDHSISASFEKLLFDIEASTSENGSISPEGVAKVPYQESMTFSISPDEGYLIEEVLVNGISEGVINSYTFEDVMNHQTISASFVRSTVLQAAQRGNYGIYPNPSSGEFSLSYVGQIKKVMIISMEGKMMPFVHDSGFDHIRLTGSDVKAGVYLVKVYFSEDEFESLKLLIDF